MIYVQNDRNHTQESMTLGHHNFSEVKLDIHRIFDSAKPYVHAEAQQF